MTKSFAPKIFSVFAVLIRAEQMLTVCCSPIFQSSDEDFLDGDFGVGFAMPFRTHNAELHRYYPDSRLERIMKHTIPETAAEGATTPRIDHQ